MSKKVAVLVETDFHDLEFWYPYLRLVEEGLNPVIVAPEAPREYIGKYGTHIESQCVPSSLTTDDLSGVVIPGGWAPDKLRVFPEMVKLVREIYDGKGIVAGICHAGSLLVSAGIINGKRVTSYKSIKDDMTAAGAEWVDEPVVTCGNLITSRCPADLPFFAKALVTELMK